MTSRGPGASGRAELIRSRFVKTDDLWDDDDSSAKCWGEFVVFVGEQEVEIF